MTYAGLSLVFLALAGAVGVLIAWVVRPSRGWWVATAGTTLVLLVLTVVFDSLMISADLFRFAEDQLLGAHVGRAPLEDLAWPLASAAMLPALWLLLGRFLPVREEDAQ